METLYSIALSRSTLYTTEQCADLLRQYHTAEAAVKAAGIDVEMQAQWMQEAQRVQQDAQRRKIRVVPFCDNAYPAALRDTREAPAVLYALGALPEASAPMISIVGTRKATQQGMDFCRDFVHQLAKLVPNAVVISGLAYGIDVTAHLAAMEAGLRTLAVMGTGLDTIYPAAHRGVAERILRSGGALLTEYPCGTRSSGHAFLRRNRIIAGLAQGVLVVECACRSGSLSTAAHAKEYQRFLMAVPGRPGDELSAGPNLLIRTGQARLITSASDVCDFLHWDKQAPSAVSAEPSLFDQPAHSDVQQRILELLKGKESLHLNVMALALDMPVAALQVEMLELEMAGEVRVRGGGRYSL